MNLNYDLNTKQQHNSSQQLFWEAGFRDASGSAVGGRNCHLQCTFLVVIDTRVGHFPCHTRDISFKK